MRAHPEVISAPSVMIEGSNPPAAAAGSQSKGQGRGHASKEWHGVRGEGYGHGWEVEYGLKNAEGEGAGRSYAHWYDAAAACCAKPDVDANF